MGIDPDDLGVWLELLHTGDGANGLRMVASQDDGVVAVFESLEGLLPEIHGRADDI